MSDPWIKWSEQKPRRQDICDFLFPGDEQEERIWVLCSAAKIELLVYSEPSYWRLAAPLPEDIDVYVRQPAALGETAYTPAEEVEEFLDCHGADDALSAEEDVEEMVEHHYAGSLHDASEVPYPGCVICEVLHALRDRLAAAGRLAAVADE